MSTIRHIVAGRKRVKLYHGTSAGNAAAILANGFELRLIKPRWQNDYAVSTLTSPKAILKYFGNKPGLQIIEMTFEGNMEDMANVPRCPSGFTAPEYTNMLTTSGVDAVILSGPGARQVFVYNVSALSNLRLWQAP